MSQTWECTFKTLMLALLFWFIRAEKDTEVQRRHFKEKIHFSRFRKKAENS